jgi:hypothetical protein
MTKRRLFLELLENKKKVKNDKLFEFHSSPEVDESAIEESFKVVDVPNVPQLEESLLKDLLESEDLNSKNLNHQKEEEKNEPKTNKNVSFASANNSSVTQRDGHQLIRLPSTRESLTRLPSRRESLTRLPSRRESSREDSFRRGTLTGGTLTGGRLRDGTLDAERSASEAEPVRKDHHDEIKKAEITIKKQELLIKFDILRKNSQRHIPMYTLNHNYSVMKHHYKLLVKQLHIDNKITFYKQCLLGFSGYLEIFLGEAFMGLDMKGYTEFQANNMSHYDKILLKIGEKSYLPQTMSSMPVEVQLLISVGIQTAIFVGSKMISNKTGLNIASLFKTNVDVNLDMPKS